jgi:hypothetical protein
LASVIVTGDDRRLMMRSPLYDVVGDDDSGSTKLAAGFSRSMLCWRQRD